MNSKKRAAIYVRVSTVEQETDMQETELWEYCNRRGWETILYRDHSQSGAKQDRPALSSLLSDLRKRKIDVIFGLESGSAGKIAEAVAQHFRRMPGTGSRSRFS